MYFRDFHVKRTVCLKLVLAREQSAKFRNLAERFSSACNAIVSYACENRCFSRVRLHHLVYYEMRAQFPDLGSQMTCNASKRVAAAYQTLQSNKGIAKNKPVKVLKFTPKSVHFDKRTYSIKHNVLSLFTLEGRERVSFVCGDIQSHLLAQGTPKEAELNCRNGTWFFNLVLDIPDVEPQSAGCVLGLDVGENNLAATSSGLVFGGGEMRHRRDEHLAHRRRLQSNGTRKSISKLRKVSGTEQRHVKRLNHEVSKAIVTEALRCGAREIRMEDLTHIRKNIKAGKRVRSRLHRWPFRQLQDFVAYKAQAVGISVVFVDPAYTSQTCSVCDCLGKRKKHFFECSCGARRHADVNAAANIAGFAMPIGNARAAVNQPNGDMLACSKLAHKRSNPLVQLKASPLRAG